MGAGAPERIAIVGMAGRFPGAADVDALWRNLAAGREAIRDLSDDELARAGVPEALRRDPAWVRRGATLEDVGGFDAAFFGFSPREALVTDPQQRLLLELAWEAFEDAGLVPARLEDAAGVFVGASRSDYATAVLADPSHAAALGVFALDVATSRDFLATRLAYVLGLRGPALTVQTACSTSLVAVHLACQSLLAGECELALAGGVSIRLPQGSGYPWVEGGVASPDGRCRAFDRRAAGTVAGNGGALVLLRPLEDALRAGDPIHALILASAVNNDGRAKVGFTAPSVTGQAAVIEEALALAEVEPASIGYVEAHGTGTPLGDPIEVAALAEAFARRGGAAPGACRIGSLKGHLGHLDAAAGVAGLVKAVLALGAGQIPPQVSFEQPNPELHLERTPFRVATALEGWPRTAAPRRAGVSSFGIGGTNAHAVLEQAPARPAPAPAGGVELAVLSARTPAALARAARNLAQRLEGDPGLAAREVAFTLQTGRTAFPHRAFALGRDARELAAALSAADLATGRAAEPAPAPAFLFPGQGSQFAGMALGAWEREAAVGRELERAARVLAPHFDLRRLLADGAALQRTRFTQPALFAVEHALARWWMELGLEPAAMLGHSLGEFVAAALAEVFSFEDGLRLVVERGRSMDELPAGAMLAVSLAEADLAEHLGSEVQIASINGPELTVVAGPQGALEALEQRLAARQVPFRRLATSHAFHSRMMEPARESFRAALERVELRAPRRPFLSNTSGTWIRAEEARSPEYWAEQLVAPVRLFEGLATLARAGHALALEVGPGRSFASPARAAGLATVASLPRGGPEGPPDLRAALGRLWLRGVEVDWAAVHGAPPPRRVRLGTYPFERRTYLAGAAAEPQAAEPRAAEPVPADSVAEGAPGYGPGADPVAARIAGIWRECLGVEAVVPTDDFLELGGSSLLAITVRARLARELGCELSLADLLEATRLDELAARVAGRRGAARGAGSPLVRLGQGARPLFLVHGVDGEVAAFAALGRALAPDLCLWALRAPGLEAGEEAVADVAELARLYVEALRADFPGPYLLAGHSFGGLVALEMARLLNASGEAASPCLIDTHPAGECGPGLPAQEELEAAARTRLAELGLGAEPAELERRLAVLAAHTRAALGHRPRPHGGPSLLILAAGTQAPLAAERARAWRGLLSPGLRLVTVPGDHLSMLSPPHAADLAHALAAWAGSATVNAPPGGRT